MQLIIDRIEDGIAVLEYEEGKHVQLPAALLPSGAKEGDALAFCIDRKTTDDKKEQAENLRKRLFHRE